MNRVKFGSDARVPAAIFAIFIHALLFWLLLRQSSNDSPQSMSDSLIVIAVPVRPLPVPPDHRNRARRVSSKHRNRAAPKNLKAIATSVVVPQPIVQRLVPPPIAAARIAGIGRSAAG